MAAIHWIVSEYFARQAACPTKFGQAAEAHYFCKAAFGSSQHVQPGSKRHPPLGLIQDLSATLSLIGVPRPERSLASTLLAA